jgi:RsiW-degrading membrane proteinase PrsW (M82 family)
MDKFNQLIIQFNQSDLDPQFFMSFFKELLASPLVITAIFVTVGFLMPLTEELLKPLGLWALRKRLLTPAEGFTGGLICGAGFALIESATMIAQTGGSADWGKIVVLRIGTSLLHMTASGFVGWGLASAWRQKKYGRTMLTILAATAVHGLWNSMAILIVLLPLLSATGASSTLMQNLQGIGTFTLASILTFVAIALFLLNRRLRRETQSSPAEVNPPPSVG